MYRKLLLMLALLVGMTTPAIGQAHRNAGTKSASKDLVLSDFVTTDAQMQDVSGIFADLVNKGFSENENHETGEVEFKRGDIVITYSEDFDDDGPGSKCITITFPEIEDAYDFLKHLQGESNWTKQRVSLGELYESRSSNLSLYREINTVQISDIISQ